MRKTALLIMAAGIGSRYAGGVKQLEAVGAKDELIIDYSIHDALMAGFNKIVFVIRRDIEADFRDRIGDRVERVCAKLGVETAYAFQALGDIPEGFAVPDGRAKPWGTGQAVLAARDLLREPFAVINADDYYGKAAFQKLHDWLVQDHGDDEVAMAGFILKNTLSENGGVTRGVCKLTPDGQHLCDVVETGGITKTADRVTAGGESLDPDAYVSMNFWGFPAAEGRAPAYLALLERDFADFFRRDVPRDPLKAEYLLPIHIGSLLRAGQLTVQVLETPDKWYGITYREDLQAVRENFRRLIGRGEYAEELYGDLPGADKAE